MIASDAVGSHAYSRMLVGSEKVAILLLALNRPLAGQLLRHFEDDEIDRIRLAAESLKPISADDLEGIVEEFASQISGGSKLIGGPAEFQDLLNDALNSDEGDPTAADDEEPQEEASVWEQLEQVPEETFLLFLLGEHPQTIAVVLSNLDSDYSAKIVAQMSQELSAQVMRRMLGMKQVHAEVLTLLEDTLQETLLADEEQSGGNAAHSRIANIINRMDGEQRQQMIEGISAVAPDEAEAIKKLLFSFEDIEKLSEKACQTLFGAVPTEMTIMSLHGIDDVMREKVLSALSTRSRRMVEIELSSESDASAGDIAEARLKVAGIALRLIESEQIQVEDDEKEGEG